MEYAILFYNKIIKIEIYVSKFYIWFYVSIYVYKCNTHIPYKLLVMSCSMSPNIKYVIFIISI